MDILTSDFKIKPLLKSVTRKIMSDEEYFSKEYSNYISNSRLKYINPDQGGSPELYKNGITSEFSNSLVIGTAVHQLFLQPDEFKLVRNMDKPGGKLGGVVEIVKKYRNLGYTLNESFNIAFVEGNYYANSISANKIKNVIKKGLSYYLKINNINSGDVILSDSDLKTCVKCIKSLNSNKYIKKLINPTDLFFDPLESYNEDAIFMDIEVSYKNKKITLPLKMKADNWTIDHANQIVVLNDLKTTGKYIDGFMKHSFVDFHYNRQLAMYLWMLKQYCKKEYNCNEEWSFKSNIICVETSTRDIKSDVFSISSHELNKGMKELNECLIRVAYHEMFGYEKNINLI